jgi:nucleotide-binding universal stress UspA family protein
MPGPIEVAPAEVFAGSMITEAPVLLAYDGSDLAKAGIREAARLLRKDQAAIVVTVWEETPGVAPTATPFVEQFTEDAERTAQEGARLAEQHGFRATPVVLEGAPTWDRIVAAAQEVKAEVIVLGSHGRSGLVYTFLGSVATAVAHHATCAVLIVNGTDAQASNGSVTGTSRAADQDAD